MKNVARLVCTYTSVPNISKVLNPLFLDDLRAQLGAAARVLKLSASMTWPAGFQYRTRVEEIKNRVWDLLAFLRRNVYHPDFHGSFSLKSVLPAFLPELTYPGIF